MSILPELWAKSTVGHVIAHGQTAMGDDIRIDIDSLNVPRLGFKLYDALSAFHKQEDIIQILPQDIPNQITDVQVLYDLGCERDLVDEAMLLNGSNVSSTSEWLFDSTGNITKQPVLKHLTYLHLVGREFDDTIPMLVFKLKSMVTLRIENFCLNLKDCVTDMPSLKTLVMRKNKLRVIPDSFFDGIGKLQELDLADNNLSVINRAIQKLPRLISLDISTNPIAALPDEIDTLTALKTLDISHTRVHSLPNLSGCLSLHTLNMTKIKTTWFTPRWITAPDLVNVNTIPELKIFRMPGIGIPAVPNSILESKFLIELDMSHNPLNEIKTEIGDLLCLQQLCLSHSGLTTLPSSIGLLTNLRTLILSHNEITLIPTQFGSLKLLRSLNCSHNKLTELPLQVWNITSLSEVDLNHNNIQLLPKNIFRLRKLNLSDNELKCLPTDIPEACTIEELNVENNNLHHVQSIGLQTNLKTLRLNGNQIMVLQELNSLTRLTELSLFNLVIHKMNEESYNTYVTDTDKDETNNLVSLIRFANPFLLSALDYLAKSPKYAQAIAEMGGVAELIPLVITGPTPLVRCFAAHIIKNLAISGFGLDVFNNFQFPQLMGMLQSDDCPEKARCYIADCVYRVGNHNESRAKLRETAVGFLKYDESTPMKVQNHFRRALAAIGCHSLPKGRGVRILCVDGGGTRGYLSVLHLRKLEELTGKPIHELFDVIAGTSTGSIIATLCCVTKVPMVEVLRIYRETCQVVFGANAELSPDALAQAQATDSSFSLSKFSLLSPWPKIAAFSNLIRTKSFYDTDLFEHVIRANLGPKCSMNLIDTAKYTHTKYLVVATCVSTQPSKAHLFRNYNLPNDNDSRFEGTSSSRVWQAVRASSAAPGYFDAYKEGGEIYVDGALVANNPTFMAMYEADRIFPDSKLDLVVSLGNGLKPTKPAANSISEFFAALIDNATENEKTAYMLEELLPKMQVPYFRMNFADELFDDWPLDEVRTEKFELLDTLFANYYAENAKKYDEIAAILLGNTQDRMETS